MPPRFLHVNPHFPRPDALVRAGEVLVMGGLVVHPTETVYGVSAAVAPDAVKKLNTVKRSDARAYALLVPNVEWCRKLWSRIDVSLEGLLDRFWPGPLTVIAKASGRCPRYLQAEDGTLGMRVSSSPVVAGFFDATPGLLLVSSSANRAGRQTPKTGREAADELGSTVELVLESGKLAPSKPSTVVRVEGDTLGVLRSGVVSMEDLRSAWKGEVREGVKVG